MLLTDTLPDQPTFAYVVFNVGGEDLLYSSADATKCLLSFNYVRRTPSEGNTWEFQLFDKDWDYLESKIAAHHQMVRIRYGYYDKDINNLSPYFTGRVDNIVPRLEIDGTILTVTGTSDIYMYDFHQNLERRFRKWGGKGILISDIVRQICENNRWYLKDFVETAPVYEIDDMYFSYPTEKIFYQDGVSDLAFIKNTLIPSSVTNDGIGGFRFWFDDMEQARTGYPICYFKPYEDWRAPVSKTYLYMRGHFGYGEVISWQPDLSQRWTFLLQGYNSKMSQMDIYTKRSISTRAILEAPAEILGSGNSQPYTQNIVTGRATAAGDYNHRVALNLITKNFLAIARQDDANPSCVEAEIVVAGDPHRVPDENILVICQTNHGTLHYSSGVYKILQITDNIDASGFTSTFNLFRNIDVERSLEYNDFDVYLSVD